MSNDLAIKNQDLSESSPEGNNGIEQVSPSVIKEEFLGDVRPDTKGIVEADQIHLPQSERISGEEFETIKKHRQKEGIFFSPFLFQGQPNKDNPYTVNFTVKDGAVAIVATVPPEIIKGISPETFSKVLLDTEHNQIAYPPTETTQLQNTLFEEKYADLPYCIDNSQRRDFIGEEQSTTTITPEEFISLLDQTPGESLMFYSGAGISLGGESPVWGMAEFNEQLHLQPTSPEDPEGVLKSFLPELLQRPDEIAQSYAEFNQQLYIDIPTPAHQAIAQIVDAKPGSLIITENLDLKHEAEGSRTSAVHLDSTPQSFDIVKKRAETTQVLVTVGLSADDRAVIAYLKEKNSDLKIVAFARKNIPRFIQGDTVLWGDMQQILPEVAKSVKTRVNTDTSSHA